MPSPYVAPAWVAPYIGLPYRQGATGPDAWDCRGLVHKVLQEMFGLSLPGADTVVPWFADTAEERVWTAGVMKDTARQAVDWQRVAWREHLRAPLSGGPLRQGDVLVLLKLGMPRHLGIAITPKLMLHTDEGHGAIVEEIDTNAEGSRVAFAYRHLSLI